MSTKILVDDRDSSVTYSGSWELAGGSDEYSETTSFAETTGSSATLRFSGIGVSVYGTIANTGLGEPPATVYSVDNGAKTSFLAVMKSTIQYKQLFYKSGVLNSGDHTLVVSLGNTGWLYLDYFEVTQAPAITSIDASSTTALPVTKTPTTTLPSSTSSLPSSSQSSQSFTTTGNSTLTVSHTTEYIVTTALITDGSKASGTTSTPSATTKNSVSIGPIIGGVLGGIIILALLFALLICRKRRRLVDRRVTVDPSDSSISSPRTAEMVTPFPIIPQQFQSDSHSPPSSTGQQTSHFTPSQSKGAYSSIPSQTMLSKSIPTGSLNTTALSYMDAGQSDLFTASGLSTYGNGSAANEKIESQSRPQSILNDGLAHQHLTGTGTTSEAVNGYDPPPSYSRV